MTRRATFIGTALLLSAGATAAAQDSTTWYETAVAAILDTACAKCHGEKRQRGDLALHTAEAIRSGGSSGPVVPATAVTDPATAELIRRVTLPLEHDDHMPPEGRTQLTAAQIEMLTAWAAAGAPFDAPAPASAPVSVTVTAPTSVTVSVTAAPLPRDAIARLSAAHVHVEIIDPEAGTLWIDFAATPTMPAERVVALLGPLAPHTSDLTLRGMKHASAVLAECAPWPRLRALNLSRATLDRPALAAAAKSGHLAELRLVETTLTLEAAGDLFAVKGLKRIHTWGSNIPAVVVELLAERVPDLVVNTGAVDVPAPVETEPPFTLGGAMIEVPAALLAVNTTCPVSAAPVNAKFSIVHEGRVVAFCCEKCAASFWADPAKYEVVADRGR